MSIPLIKVFDAGTKHTTVINLAHVMQVEVSTDPSPPRRGEPMLFFQLSNGHHVCSHNVLEDFPILVELLGEIPTPDLPED